MEDLPKIWIGVLILGILISNIILVVVSIRDALCKTPRIVPSSNDFCGYSITLKDTNFQYSSPELDDREVKSNDTGYVPGDDLKQEFASLVSSLGNNTTDPDLLKYVLMKMSEKKFRGLTFYLWHTGKEDRTIADTRMASALLNSMLKAIRNLTPEKISQISQHLKERNIDYLPLLHCILNISNDEEMDVVGVSGSNQDDFEGRVKALGMYGFFNEGTATLVFETAGISDILMACIRKLKRIHFNFDTTSTWEHASKIIKNFSFEGELSINWKLCLSQEFVEFFESFIEVNPRTTFRLDYLTGHDEFLVLEDLTTGNHSELLSRVHHLVFLIFDDITEETVKSTVENLHKMVNLRSVSVYLQTDIPVSNISALETRYQNIENVFKSLDKDKIELTIEDDRDILFFPAIDGVINPT